jgi:hydroxymethylglutaryl-CoA reductase
MDSSKMDRFRPKLPKNFRKLPIQEKRETLRDALGIQADEEVYLEAETPLLELADAMVESAVGILPIPLGIAGGFVIDGESYDIPLATEEPSVIAAASFGARLIARSGGFVTEAEPPIMTTQVYLSDVSVSGEEELRRNESTIRCAVSDLLRGMEARGGGYRGFDVSRLSEVVRVQLYVDVRDAMGANLLNTVAEAIRPLLAEISGGTSVMAILTNSAESRRAGASFSIPVDILARGGFSGREAADRIVTGYRIAALDPSRAVTHNKGIMNGVSGLALATGNDTRGLEAAVHSYACSSGTYRPLSKFEVEAGRLNGSIQLPVPLATVGGAVSFHPVAKLCLRLLGSPKATDLARIAAALGLAQNFAAVYALVTEGIQKGHMSKHANRVAWKAGFRRDEGDVRTQAVPVSSRRDRNGD